MKTILSFALLLITLSLFAEAVQVQDGDYSFSIDSVKVLQQLLKDSATKQQNPRTRMTSNAAVCASPSLPQEFKGICQKGGSAMVFSRLALVQMDVCEICAFAACTGC